MTMQDEKMRIIDITRGEHATRENAGLKNAGNDT